MTAAEQQISGNPAAMENAQARTTVTDQAKVLLESDNLTATPDGGF